MSSYEIDLLMVTVLSRLLVVSGHFTLIFEYNTWLLYDEEQNRFLFTETQIIVDS